MKRVKLNRPALPPACLRLHEVAALLHVSKHTVRASVRQGKFPKPIKTTEAMMLWRRSAVAAWLDANEAASSPRRSNRHPHLVGRASAPTRDSGLEPESLL